MVIDTKEISSRVKLGSMLAVLVFAIVVVLDLIFTWLPKHILEYTCLILFVLMEAFLIIRKFNYILYNSDGFKIILKYTSLGMLSSGNYRLEIPKKDFVDVEIKKSCLGLRKMILIYVKSPQGIAKFKPISVSIMSSKELNDMIEDLNSFKS